MTEVDSGYVKVHSLSNRFEADFIAGALEREGIPVLVRSFEDTAYSALFIPQKGWGRIMVPKEMADRARNIIAGLVIEEETEEAAGRKIEPGLWEELRRADPSDVMERAIVEFDPDENVYIVPLFNSTVLCYPESEEIETAGVLENLSGDFQLSLLILHYLLHAQNKYMANRWVTEKDLPGGALFFTAAHTLPFESLADAFDIDRDKMEAAARSIGGEKIDSGGLAYRFRILPRIPIQIIYWNGDEEFGSSFHILFDETITLHLGSLDLVWGLVNVLAGVLLDVAKQNDG